MAAPQPFLTKFLYRSVIYNRMTNFGLLCFFVNGPYPATFLYFHLFNTQLTVIKCSLKSCSRLDSNRGPLVSKVTALPTELQPLKTFVTSISLSVLQPNFWRTSQRRSDGCTSRRLWVRNALRELMGRTSLPNYVYSLKNLCEPMVKNKRFFKFGQPRLLFHLFSPFRTHITNFTTNWYLKICPSSMWCWDLNSWPLEHESPPITTRPGLPPK